MFADATFDSQRADYAHRGWATLTSFAVQAVAVMCLLVLPLFYTQGLPQFRLTSRDVFVPPQGEPPVTPSQPHVSPGGGTAVVNPTGLVLREPGAIPLTIAQGGDVDAPHVNFDEVGTGGGPGAGPFVPGSLGIAPAPVVPPPAVRPAVRVSSLMEGSLMRRVEPPYPTVAKMAGIQGAVVMAAIIGRDRTVQNLQVISGHPMLVQAAINAVKQWRYRPYVLNGESVEVETRITVNFILSR